METLTVNKPPWITDVTEYFAAGLCGFFCFYASINVFKSLMSLVKTTMSVQIERGMKIESAL